jgi:hypothetical protein
MIEKIKLFLSALAIAMLTGCGHNAIVFDKGFGLHAGVDPEHFSADVRFVYGEPLTLVARDNLELELVSDVEGGKDSLLHSRKWRAIELTHLAVNKSGRTLDLFFAFFGKNCVVKTADCNSNLVFHIFISI